MKNTFTKEWFVAVMIRTIRTMSQTALATIGTCALLSEVNWTMVGSATVMAGVLCVLMSLSGLPEATGSKDGDGK